MIGEVVLLVKKWKGWVRFLSGKDQGMQENRGQDCFSGEGLGSSDSFSDEAIKVRTPVLVKSRACMWGVCEN